jgi:hypothetical protein
MRTHGWKWTGALGLLALLALPACKQAEHLDQRREAAERELAALQQLLATSKEQQYEVRQLMLREARFAQQLSAPTPEAIAQVFAALPGIRVVPEADGNSVVTGRAPLEAFAERLLALGQVQPGVSVAVLRVDGDAVEARLHVERPEEPPPPTRPSPIGRVLPWNLERLKRLREVEVRIDQLRAVLPDVLEHRDELQWRFNALQELAARAAGTRTHTVAIARLLAGARPLLGELEVQPREDVLQATGQLAPGVTPKEVRDALVPSFQVRHMEPVGGGLRVELAPAPVAAGTSP